MNCKNCKSKKLKKIIYLNKQPISSVFYQKPKYKLKNILLIYLNVKNAN